MKNSLNSSDLQVFSGFKKVENILEDTMEILDPAKLEQKVQEVEREYRERPDEINTVRLGIIYHEMALNSSFYSKNRYKGYARKSYSLLNGTHDAGPLHYFLKPFRNSYKASALALIGAETKNVLYVGRAFKEFEKVVHEYSETVYLPEFLRGSVAENLPWFFFAKKKFAQKDFNSLVRKHQLNPGFATDKIMSFVYLGLAIHAKRKNNTTQSLEYLEKAISLDPKYIAARKKAEEEKRVLL